MDRDSSKVVEALREKRGGQRIHPDLTHPVYQPTLRHRNIWAIAMHCVGVYILA